MKKMKVKGHGGTDEVTRLKKELAAINKNRHASIYLNPL